MGRPRKRRREENVDHGLDDIDPFRVAVDDFQSQDSGLDSQIPAIPAIGSGPRGFQDTSYTQKAASLRDSVAGIDSLPPNDLFLDFDRNLGLGDTFDLGDWNQSQDLTPYFSETTGNAENANQLPTPRYTENVTQGIQPVPTYTAGCHCLPNLYSTLASFQTMPPLSFPYSMGILKSAAKLGQKVVLCQNCSLTFNTALQNATLLDTLVQMIINEYAKLLKHIDERAAREEKIAFRLGERGTELDSRHTGGPDCPMAIDIDLDGQEWRTLAKKAVRQELFGDGGGEESLSSLVQSMRDRQISWHGNFSKEQCPSGHNVMEHDRSKERVEQICIRVHMIDNLTKRLQELQT